MIRCVAGSEGSSIGWNLFASGASLRDATGGTSMLKWALIFLVISLITGFLGFSGVSSATATISKVLFAIALVIFLIFIVLALMAGSAVV
jgi:uncharacterized membrane protein YtjA (UPF0391 family)